MFKSIFRLSQLQRYLYYILSKLHYIYKYIPQNVNVMPLEQSTTHLAMKLENVPVNQDIPGQNVMSVSRDTLKLLMELAKV